MKPGATPETLATRAATGRGVCCPRCGQPGGSVMDTRTIPGAVRRRRECLCGARYTTYERVDLERHQHLPGPDFGHELEDRLDEVLERAAGR